MSDVTTSLTAAAFTLATSVAVALFIRRHLRIVLTDLTGAAARAEFWIAFTSLLLVLVPLIVLMFVPRDTDVKTPAVFRVVAQLRWSLVGLIATLISYDVIIIWFVQTRPPQAGSHEP